jgi:hypothetical protein
MISELLMVTRLPGESTALTFRVPSNASLFPNTVSPGQLERPA